MPEPIPPLEAERARLRAAGLSDDEIANVLANRGLPGAPAQPVATGAPQSTMSGVMSNISAVWGHAQNVIPAIVAQLVTAFDTSATAAVRVTAFLSVLVKIGFVCVFAYVASLEFSQLKSGAERARVDACDARQKYLYMSRPAARFTPEGKEETERFLRAQGIPPKIQTPEEIEKEKRQFQETKELDERFKVLYAQWKKDCGDVAPY